ncbi:unnamed protein product [marine sediment metagenome]|uniref:Uncharacterized protein n=1 Tax=marine sediment metagenome TaxID=412755 RepID=X1MKT4_9ZZZZ
MLYSNAKSRQKGIDGLKSFGQTDDEQSQGKGALLSRLLGEVGIEDLIHFESELTGRQNQVLFEIATEIEDTESAVRQTEQLIQRLKKHLDKLKDLQRVLSK